MSDTCAHNGAAKLHSPDDLKWRCGLCGEVVTQLPDNSWQTVEKDDGRQDNSDAGGDCRNDSDIRSSIVGDVAPLPGDTDFLRRHELESMGIPFNEPEDKERPVSDPRIAKLHELAKELYNIADTLDASGVACNGCGSFRRNNWDDWVLRQKVEGAVVTVSNLATAFERADKRKAVREIGP